MSLNQTNLSQEAMQQAILKFKEVKDDPTRFGIYENDPEGFCREVLGVELWSKQLDVLRATLQHSRVAVRSGHGTGKTFVVACLVLWWLYGKRGRVITTAPTWNHVEGVLWAEIHSLRKRARTPLPAISDGLTALSVDPRDKWDATGLSTNTPSAFQGYHHPRLLVVVDEAPGVSEQVHLEISTLTMGGAANVTVMIGNPTVTSGTFYEAFKNQNVWYCFRISCFEHPNVVADKELIPGAVTREKIEEWRGMWGENHPFWFSRVLGDFPKTSNKGIIPLGSVESAINEEERQKALVAAEAERIPRLGGLDVARYGENECVLTIRRGDAVETIIPWHHKAITETCGLAVQYIKEYGLKALIVDASGIGAGVVDVLLEQGQPVYAYNGGARAFTPSSYTNRRTEMWWHLRQRFEHKRLWLPDAHTCRKLIGDLVSPEYEVNSSGRIKAETKEQLLARGVKSPDYADSLVLCFALDEDPEAFLQEPAKDGRDQWAEDALTSDEEAAPYSQFPHGF